jgi:hypothetical protein
MQTQDTGRAVKTVKAIAPADRSAGTTNGDTIDRNPQGSQSYDSAQLHVNVGAASGTPTSFTLDVEIEHSTDGGTTWANFKPDGTNDATVQVVTASSEARLPVNLRGAGGKVRAVGILAFVGGTSPKLLYSATITLGSAGQYPA